LQIDALRVSADDGGMRRAFVFGVAFAGALAGVGRTQAPPSYHLFFLGHEIGTETDTLSKSPQGSHLEAVFHFLDRGTAIDLTGTLDQAPDGTPRHFLTKGKNYRLFSSDAEVTIADRDVHVRDLKLERDLQTGGKPFFPIDNYAPIAFQDALIAYWYSHGRPAEINAPPAGVVAIRETRRGYAEGAGGRGAALGTSGSGSGTSRAWQELSIDGVLWGREAAFVDPSTHALMGLATWAGNLPFEAVRTGDEHLHDTFMRSAVAARMSDMADWTSANPPVHTGTYALVGARVIQATDAPPIENATIVIRANRLAAVGPSASTPVPSGVPSVDVKGSTIVPGLWDMHAHAGQTDWSPVYLASGVTTIRDMGGEEDFLVAIRDAIESGKAVGPRYLLAGLVDGPGPHAFGKVVAGTPDEGRAVTRRYHDEHFQEMKLYTDVKDDVGKAIIDEAHRLGMTVTGHVPTDMRKDGVGGPGTGVVEDGFDGIAHMQLRGTSGSDASKAQIAFFKEHRTVMDPTESWNELSGHPASIPLNDLLPGVNRLPLSLTRMFASMSWGAGDAEAFRTRQRETLKLLKDAVDAGLLVVAGTDKGVPGFSLQREIELYVDGGMTPLQAIQAATIMPARAMRIDKDVGTIEVGKRADLAVLTGNPLETIRNIRTARWVVANGRMYDCDVLWRVAGYGPVDRAK
jgi:imidazolonepropionase-like amidohydrolase